MSVILGTIAINDGFPEYIKVRIKITQSDIQLGTKHVMDAVLLAF